MSLRSPLTCSLHKAFERAENYHSKKYFSWVVLSSERCRNFKGGRDSKESGTGHNSRA